MLNKLSLFCYVDKDFDDKELEAFKKEMERNYPVNLIIEEFDGKDAEWTIRKSSKGDKMYLSDEYNAKLCQPVYDKYFSGVDMVGIFIDSKNWKNTKRRLLGTQFGKKHNGYYVFSCKHRRGYEGTGEHEALHAIDNYIKRYLGIRLETLFKVKDFDDDIVHGKEYWRRGYFYDKVWDKLAKVLSAAIAKKRSQKPVLSLTSLSQRAVEAQYKASESIEEPKYKYFKLDEKTGSVGTVADLKPELVEMLDEARGLAGIPFKINSGFRSPEHNKRVGGSKNSDHLTGDAVDIACTTTQARFKIIDAALKVGLTRIGIGKNFVHLGLAKHKAQGVIWTYYK